MNRLPDQRMIGNLNRPRQILRARGAVGKHSDQQVVGSHAQQGRRNFLASPLADDGERARGVPSPARREHGRGQQSLHQQRLGGAGRQVRENLFERKAVLRPEREHNGVLVGGGLQFKIEAAAEAFAQRQAPGAVDPSAEGRVHNQLHPAGRVEEPLQDEGLLRRQVSQRLLRRAEVSGDLRRRGFRDACLFLKPAHGLRGLFETLLDFFAQFRNFL